MTELDLAAIAKAYGKYRLDLPGSTPLTVVRVFQQVPYLIDEIRRLEAQAEQIKALHKRAHAVGTRTGLRYEDPCPECDGKKGAHDCGCWGAFDTVFVCAECHRLGSGSKGVYDYTYPCPTIKALADSEVESDIDAYDIMKLRHMLGMKPHIPESAWGYRNYYVAMGNNVAVMERLCEAGFVKHEGGYYYRATRKGAELVGLTGKQLERALGEENGN